jgi:hypothetical protein
MTEFKSLQDIEIERLGGMPALQGSEKQVKWANDLRANAISGLLIKIRMQHLEGQVVGMARPHLEQAFLNIIQGKAASQASWWINQRAMRLDVVVNNLVIDEEEELEAAE